MKVGVLLPRSGVQAGIGQDCQRGVEIAAHEARQAGLSLTVVAAPAARGFYEKCGFSVEGDAETRFGPALRMSR